MRRADRITSALKKHDSELYCVEHMEGKLCVMRKSHRWETYSLDEDSTLQYLRASPFFIFALTDNWKLTGNPVDRGIEPIMARIKAIDLWNRDLASEIIDQTEKEYAEKDRDRNNKVESFLYDFRSQFKKTFSDVNVSNLKKEKIKEKIWQS